MAKFILPYLSYRQSGSLFYLLPRKHCIGGMKQGTNAEAERV